MNSPSSCLSVSAVALAGERGDGDCRAERDIPATMAQTLQRANAVTISCGLRWNCARSFYASADSQRKAAITHRRSRWVLGRASRFSPRTCLPLCGRSRFYALCYTSGHRHETHLSVSSRSVPLAIAPARRFPRRPRTPPDMATPQEKHLRNVHQLTFGGQNAESYFSADSKKLIFQSSHGDVKCDQIFTMNIDGSDQHMVSTGKGRTTCSFFYPDGKKILYASTHLASPECPPRPDFSKGYVWAVYSGYDIFTANPDGSNLKQLTNYARLRRRGDDLARRQEDHVHFRAQRRSRHLLDGRRRQERQATHARTGLRRRANVFARSASGSSTGRTIRRPKKKFPTTRNCWGRT